ncbi:glycerophosphodiester phosphodiesterase family protein [Microterricola viridarii]|uniref:glycerophosphodiester phosphodiesterase n=1 Tax=Microterricola viridarii TaxID=412690 RepID=A0A1H1QAA7_9MICO|nr:glycerophosphodiester phosphodiesterase family protein [Microterricola viridarii]SDS20458.1 glycerophosphoryl diester phosphodiesterase [Microterricola viridarii]
MSHASPLIIGHRGASGYRPEHTAAAYELAFALGADAVEPDIVATRDGVLVLRHENEISGTTDVAARPEFAGLRTTKTIDGHEQTGWFTEDFTWGELSTLRARERLPKMRPANTAFDGRYPILRLRDLFELIDESAERHGRHLGLVAEIKHASYFESIGLPLDELFAAELDDAGWRGGDGRLIVESFELTVLGKLTARGVGGRKVFLIEASGTPEDQRLAHGAAANSYADFVTEAGLYALGGLVDGISVDRSMIVRQDAAGTPQTSDLVDLAHSAMLEVYTWTLRPENRFLLPAHRAGVGQARHGDWWGEFELIMGTGIDGVFADHPDLAVAVRDSLRPAA